LTQNKRYEHTCHNTHTEGGEKVNNKMDILINHCFDYLRGVFSRQQAFFITLGVALIKWMEQTEKYAISAKSISKALTDADHLGQEIKRHEDEFPEFKGILSTLLSRLFENPGDYLKELYWQMNSKEARTKEDFQELINQIVQIGPRESGFTKTPSSIARLIAKFQDINSIGSFADFSAGTSSIALEIFRQSYHQPYYYAEEINTTAYLISKLLMIANEVRDYRIVNKDAFSEGKLDGIQQFDLVVSDIPRNLRYHKALNLNDPRFRYGPPAKANLEWAFIQNIIYRLNSRGKGIVVGSKGMLVRGFEDRIRAAIVQEDLVECVITLPDNLYEDTNIGTEVLILNRNKPMERRGGVLFINASKYRERLNPYQHTLTELGVDKILTAYHSNFQEEGFSKFVPITDMEEYDYRLNPVEYIDFESLKNQFDKTIPLSKIAQITRGVNISKKELEELESGGEYHYISIRNIDDGGVNYEDTLMIRPRNRGWEEKYTIGTDDIIITAKGWETKVALVDSNFKDSIISSNLTRIRVDRWRYNPYILVEFLQSDTGKKMLESLQTGTTVTLINNKQLGRLEVPVYPRDMMDEIGRQLEINQKTYQERVKEAEREYEDNRARLLMKLELGNGS
jgi:type I restriction-modification system DNA methylase subunit